MILACASKRAFSADACAKSDDDAAELSAICIILVNRSFSMQ